MLLLLSDDQRMARLGQHGLDVGMGRQCCRGLAAFLGLVRARLSAPDRRQRAGLAKRAGFCDVDGVDLSEHPCRRRHGQEYRVVALTRPAVRAVGLAQAGVRVYSTVIAFGRRFSLQLHRIEKSCAEKMFVLFKIVT